MTCQKTCSSVTPPPYPGIRVRPFDVWDVDRIKQIEMDWPLLSHWDIEVYHRVAAGNESARGCVALEVLPTLKEHIAGFMVYRVTHQDTELLNIAVDPSYVRRRIGTQMLHHLIDAIRALGVENLFLEVRPSNGPAREFYLKEGFIEVGRRKEYYGNPVEDAILMKYCLGQLR